LAGAATADQIVLVADRDNTLYFSDLTGELSNGSGAHMFTGLTDIGRHRRALVHFDLSTLPRVRLFRP
jgi:hypothetical protein